MMKGNIKLEKIAHIRSDGVIQTVDEHDENVGQLMKRFLSSFPLSFQQFAYEVGRLHDIGKFSEEFQSYIRAVVKETVLKKYDHSTAGGYEIEKKVAVADRSVLNDVSLLLWQYGAMAIVGHHSGLLDYGVRPNPEPGTFVSRMEKANHRLLPDYSEWQGNVDLFPIDITLDENRVNSGMDAYLYSKLLYSALVDADFLDTAHFMKEENDTKDCSSDMSKLLLLFQQYVSRFANPVTKLNQVRTQIRCACQQAGHGLMGFYSLSSPTGSGKTINSMAFALEHAVQYGLTHIIYVIPYTSIIEQTASVLRSIFGSDVVLEYHSNVDFSTLDERVSVQRQASENWDIPIIVTTTVQFFESLFANKSSKCRKLHNVANSVIIFDEFQMLPLSYAKLCLGMLSSLVKCARTTVLLCTATQPGFQQLLEDVDVSHVTEIVSDMDMSVFQRTMFQYLGAMEQIDLCQHWSSLQSFLCIVNSRKIAKKLYEMSDGTEEWYCLTQLLTPNDRQKLLQEIRERLDSGCPCKVIATSLIECGVDVDFPVVYRQVSGMDSIMQAAGRCNREGLRPMEDSFVYVFQLTDESDKWFRTQVLATEHAVDHDWSHLGNPEVVTRYFEYLCNPNSGASFDKHQVYQKIVSSPVFPYETISHSVKLIENNMVTIYIPTDKNQKDFQSLQNGITTKKLLRRMSHDAVNVYEQQAKQLLCSGKIVEIPGMTDAYLLVDMNAYDIRSGLSVSTDGITGFFG